MSTEEPLVDIGIPVAGRADYVAVALDSVLRQTVDRWRLVVQQDGPEDPAVADAVRPYLTDPRVSLRSTGTRLGAAANMTRLIAEGSAPYVALLHDDDAWDAGFLERRLDALEQHPACAYAFSRVRIIDGSGHAYEESRAPVREGAHDSRSFAPLLLRGNVVPSPSLVVRRSAYEAVGAAFSTRLRRIYDHEMWSRLALRFPVFFLDVADASWRVHEAQSSRSLHDRREDFLNFQAILEPLARTEIGTSAPTRDEWDRIVSSWLLTNALDAAEAGEGRLARTDIAHAIRLHPGRVVDPRVPAGILALTAGAPGNRALAAIRTRIRRHGIRVHISTL
jgi:glycosyltransferase involved in cell wall biosynthesis